jgi:hemin uptake protein HemP
MDLATLPATALPPFQDGGPLPGTPPAIPSEALLQGRQVVLIEHGGAVYTLRATRSGKLILTK